MGKQHVKPSPAQLRLLNKRLEDIGSPSRPDPATALGPTSESKDTDKGTTADVSGHPWKQLKTGTAATFPDDLAWAYSNATRIIRRDPKTASVRFHWKNASSKPPSSGGLTCLSWAASAPAKFFDTCRAVFLKGDSDEEEVDAMKAEKKSQEALREVLRELVAEAKREPDPYFYDGERD